MIVLAIDEEVIALIPPLTEKERAQLESNLRAEGCREPLVVWAGEPLVDATHPCQVPWVYQLALERMIEEASWLCPRCGETRQRPYVRNLLLYQRIELAARLRPLLEKKAQAHQGARTDLRPNLAGSHDTKQAIAAKQAIADHAGVSRETVRKAEVIMQEADEPTKEALRRGERSIHGVYTQLRPRQATSNGQPAPTIPEPEEHIHMTDRLSELIAAMIELAEILRGELAGRRAQFPQATWAIAYDNMQHDLGKMQEFLQALAHRAGEAQDRRMAERAASVEGSAAGTTGP